MKKLRHFNTTTERRRFLEKETKTSLTTIGSSLSDNGNSVHCENIIGATTVPLGVAGPLLIKKANKKKNVYVPLATTEGVLVASVSRGCKVLSLSGGVEPTAHRIGTTRGPVFNVGSVKNGKEFFIWLKKHEKHIARYAEKESHHLIYKKMTAKLVGQYIFVRFYFDTDNAMGMNMATLATERITSFIEKKSGVKCLSIAGNFDIDKKPSWLNAINGKGFMAWADVTIPRKLAEKHLRVTPEDFFETWLGKCMIGSAMSGSLGFNAHYANIIAAFFLATGQDLGHIVEGSMGITTSKVTLDGDLYVSVYLPSVMIATVGGGTKLKTQKESLNITGVKSSEELTEVLAAGVLAGEVSLLASLTQGTLAQVHEKLGR